MPLALVPAVEPVLSSSLPTFSPKSVEEGALLIELLQGIASANSAEGIVGLIYERSRPFLPCDRLALSLVDAQKRSFLLLSSRPAEAGIDGGTSGERLEVEFRDGQPLRIGDVGAGEAAAFQKLLGRGMRSGVAMPLSARGEPIGLLTFASREPDLYRPEHELLLRLIAAPVSWAVERFRLVEALRERTEYLENVLQSSADAIIVEDAEGRIRTWNEGARRIYGYTAEEVVGKPFEILVPPELQESKEMDALRRRVLEDGFISDWITPRISKGKRRVIVNITSTALRDPEGRVIGRSIIHRDVTHLEKLQEELVRTRSMEAVGQLAATMAHEIKNPLAGISGAMQVLRADLPPSSPVCRVTSEILDQIHRVDNTVRDLLAFARPAVPCRKEIDLAASMTAAWSVLASRPESARIRFSIGGDAGVCLPVDPQLISKVWLNLFENAIEAMPRGGDLRVTVTNGPVIAVEVRDSGAGMDPDVISRLFHPFYSTKARGTGLGLAISRKIVEAHDGTVRVESVRGKGTAVTVELPR